MPDLSDRAIGLGHAEVTTVIKAYIARRLLPRNERGPSRKWQPPFGLTHTDVYDLLHVSGCSSAVSTTRDALVQWLDDHPQYDPRPDTVEVELYGEPTQSHTRDGSGASFILDGALLESLIRAEVQRIVQGLRGEIELHVRKETQAAVQKEGERAASTLMHSMAATLEADIKMEVARQLEEFTS